MPTTTRDYLRRLVAFMALAAPVALIGLLHRVWAPHGPTSMDAVGALFVLTVAPLLTIATFLIARYSFDAGYESQTTGDLEHLLAQKHVGMLKAESRLTWEKSETTIAAGAWAKKRASVEWSQSEDMLERLLWIKRRRGLKPRI